MSGLNLSKIPIAVQRRASSFAAGPEMGGSTGLPAAESITASKSAFHVGGVLLLAQLRSLDRSPLGQIVRLFNGSNGTEAGHDFRRFVPGRRPQRAQELWRARPRARAVRAVVAGSASRCGRYPPRSVPCWSTAPNTLLLPISLLPRR